jgi:hypothetical protein
VGRITDQAEPVIDTQSLTVAAAVQITAWNTTVHILRSVELNATKNTSGTAERFQKVSDEWENSGLQPFMNRQE